MKGMYKFSLLFYLIISLSISCSKSEYVSPGPVDMEKDYYLDLIYSNIDCSESFNPEMSVYDYQDNGVDVDLVTYSQNPIQEYLVVCVTDLQPIEYEQAYIIVRYNNTVYHSFEGKVTITDNVLIDASFYEIGDRTYKVYQIRIKLLCKD